MIFYYGKFKEPLPIINGMPGLINWTQDPNKVWSYERIYRIAPEYHFYKTLYGSSTGKMLYVYCRKNSSNYIKNAEALWTAPQEQFNEMDLSNSILSNGNPYNAWLNIKEDWIAILGLENMEKYYSRTNFLFNAYGFNTLFQGTK